MGWNADGVVNFSIERCTVVVTRVATAHGARRSTVIPTIIEGGRECVVVKSWIPWMGNALAVKGDPAVKGAPHRILAPFVKDVTRALLADARRARPSLEGSDDSHAPKGRAALGLSDDSSGLSDDSSEYRDRIVCHAKARKFGMQVYRARNVCMEDYRTVTIDGLEISAKLRAREKGIVVPNDGHLANLMKVLRARFTAGSNSDVVT